jgi:hypothetical protein
MPRELPHVEVYIHVSENSVRKPLDDIILSDKKAPLQ